MGGYGRLLWQPVRGDYIFHNDSFVWKWCKDVWSVRKNTGITLSDIGNHKKFPLDSTAALHLRETHFETVDILHRVFYHIHFASLLRIWRMTWERFTHLWRVFKDAPHRRPMMQSFNLTFLVSFNKPLNIKWCYGWFKTLWPPWFVTIIDDMTLFSTLTIIKTHVITCIFWRNRSTTVVIPATNMIWRIWEFYAVIFNNRNKDHTRLQLDQHCQLRQSSWECSDLIHQGWKQNWSNHLKIRGIAKFFRQCLKCVHSYFRNFSQMNESNMYIQTNLIYNIHYIGSCWFLTMLISWNYLVNVK